MNFWKILRWVSAALFVVLIFLSLVFAHARFDSQTGDAPRPAPLIVH